MPGRTTIMNDSDVGDDWIRQVAQQNPTALLAGTDGLITTGPVRLCFCETLFTPRAPNNNAGGTPKYGTMALYTPYNDMSVFYSEYYRILGKDMPEYYVAATAATNPYPALESPFHDQAAKMQYSGFTAGQTYINHTSKFKPPLIDPQKNPIMDPAKVYPGVWAILVVSGYSYGKRPPQPKKGVAFGLQAVMIIGDDQPLAGGGVDVKEVFKGTHVIPPAINPAMLAGMVPGQPPVPPGPVGFRPPPPGAPPRMPPPPMGTQAVDEYDISSLR